jgi:hypothetical protein
VTSLADIALRFCGECLGWNRPVDRKFAQQNRSADGNGSKAWPPYIFDYHAEHDQFHYTDLNAIMWAVRGWCDKHDVSLEIYYVPYPTALWHVSTGLDPIEHTNLCNALLTACLEANTKLKATA